MIDIEKLAEEHLTPFARTGWTAYGEQLKAFAEAYAAKALEDKEREIAEFKSQTNELKSLLIDAREDVAAQLDAYQELLPYKQHRYDAQKNTLDEIDKALSKHQHKACKSLRMR